MRNLLNPQKGTANPWPQQAQSIMTRFPYHSQEARPTGHEPKQKVHAKGDIVARPQVNRAPPKLRNSNRTASASQLLLQAGPQSREALGQYVQGKHAIYGKGRPYTENSLDTWRRRVSNKTAD